MNRRTWIFSAFVIALVTATIATAGTTTSYTQTNLVSSMKSLKAKIHDKNLLNPWGLVQGPTPFWVSDNNAGVSRLYNGTGKPADIAKKTSYGGLM